MNFPTALCMAIIGFAFWASEAYAGPNAPTTPRISPSNMSALRTGFTIRAPTIGLSTSAVRPDLSMRRAETVNQDFNELHLRFASSVSSFERQTEIDDLLGRTGAGALRQGQVRRAARNVAADPSQPTGKTTKAVKSRD